MHCYVFPESALQAFCCSEVTPVAWVHHQQLRQAACYDSTDNLVLCTQIALYSDVVHRDQQRR